jgi:hypothetical protein
MSADKKDLLKAAKLELGSDEVNEINYSNLQNEVVAFEGICEPVEVFKTRLKNTSDEVELLKTQLENSDDKEELENKLKQLGDKLKEGEEELSRLDDKRMDWKPIDGLHKKPLFWPMKGARLSMADAGRGDQKAKRTVTVVSKDKDGNKITTTKEEYVTRYTSFKDPVSNWWRGFKFHKENGIPHMGDPVKALVVSGSQLSEFDDDDWRYALSRKQLTFARTLPAQKQQIVEHMQEHHEAMKVCNQTLPPHVVAVTGDGVNDSPALKTADCGVAMNTGSEVAHEAANMILMNDNFASIIEGIRQGRLIFDNLKKSIAYTLTSNIPEITPFLALILLRIPIPLETVMILCIDLGTDMLPAISLAYEEAEADIMKRKPRNKDVDHLVNARLIGLCYGMIGMIQACAGFTCYFAVFASYNIFYDDLAGSGFLFTSEDEKFIIGLDYDTRMGYLRQAQTSFLMSIIVVQWTDVMICKTRALSIFEQGMKNTVLLIGLVEELLLGLALTYVPFLNTAFKTASLDFVMWTYGMPFAILILVFDECRKGIMRIEKASRIKQVGKEAAAELKPGFVETCTYY